jgi:tetratricopeptide (TPR) repeat protein
MEASALPAVRSGALRSSAPAVAIFLIAAAVFANALWNGFALDDVAIVQQNARVHDWRALADIWLTPYWPFFGDQLGLYRPLAIFAYALQWAVAAGAPWVFHLTNLALHAVASVLVYAFVLRLLPTLGNAERAPDAAPVHTAAALLAGLVFALHPVHTEVVANIVGQAELIAAVTTLAACYLHATRRHDGLAPGRLIAIAALFALGMLAKESAIVLPALLIAIDAAQGRWRYARAPLVAYVRSMLVPVAVLTLVAVAYFALRIEVLGSIGGVHAAPNLPFLREEYRVFVAFRAWPEYVRLLVFPADLSADYSPAVILPVEGLTPMAALGAVLLGATALLALLTPAFPRAGLPAAWFLIAILPVSNLLLPIGVVVAERLLYAPSIALSLVVAFAWQRVAASPARTRRLATAAAGIMLLAAGVHVVRRNPDWKDTNAVWDALVRDHPESYRAQLINAARAMEQRQFALAKEYTELAYRLWPDDAPMLHMLSQYAQQDGDFERAIALLADAEEIAPFINTYPLARAVASISGERPQQALAALDRAAALGINRKIVEVLRAQAYEKLGRPAEAAGAWRVAIHEPGPNLWSFWALLARSLARAGARSDALAAADTAHAIAAASDERTMMLELRGAIGRGCYDAGRSADSAARPADAASCDPLAAWGLVVPTFRSNATIVQNASDGGAEAPRKGDGS